MSNCGQAEILFLFPTCGIFPLQDVVTVVAEEGEVEEEETVIEDLEGKKAFVIDLYVIQY